MKLDKECYECISNRARNVLRNSINSTSEIELIIGEFENSMKDLENKDSWLQNKNATYLVPAQLGSIRQKFLFDKSLNYNYKEEKQIGKRIGTEFYKTHENLPLNLKELLVYTLIGNGIEFDIGGTKKSEDEILTSINNDIEKLKSDQNFQNNLDIISSQIEKIINVGANICYLLDNVGEHYFDKLLIDYLIKHGCTIFVIVKGGPVLNDVTRDDMDPFSNNMEVLDTGSIDVGLFLNRIPDKLKDKLFSSDLLIIKGMAQFETLSSEILPVDSLYLFKIKCHPIAKVMNKKEGDYQIHYQKKDHSWLN